MSTAAYRLYYEEMKSVFERANPAHNLDLETVVTNMWKGLNQTQKAVYEGKAADISKH